MERKPSAQSDLLSALLWMVLGAAMFWGGWTMDRLETQHINPYTAPGLVPGLLGIGLVILGALLLLRSVRAGGLGFVGGDWPRAPELSTGRVLLALLLCLGYAAGLVGHGLPFWAATAIFVFLAIVLFLWPERGPRSAIVAIACAIGTAAGVTLVFQEIFLVRLP